MILTQKAINRIMDDEDNTIRLKLAIALKFTEGWIIQLLGKNKSNGPLTTVKAIQIIREETGLTDSQILEEEKEVFSQGRKPQGTSKKQAAIS